MREHRLLPKEEINYRFGTDRVAVLSYEAEALGQPRILQMLRDRLNALLPELLDTLR